LRRGGRFRSLAVWRKTPHFATWNLARGNHPFCLSPWTGNQVPKALSSIEQAP